MWTYYSLQVEIAIATSSYEGRSLSIVIGHCMTTEWRFT